MWSGGGKILKTVNGGALWTSVVSGCVFPLYSIFFADANTGYVVGDRGTILKTTDAGTTWSTLNSGVYSPLSSVFFTDVNTGYSVGGNIILKTINGGTDWTVQPSGTTSGLYSVYFADANTGYVAGLWSTILKTTNGGADWTPLVLATYNSFYSVCFTDANTGYIAGELGSIMKTTNGGGTGIVENPGNSNHLQIYPNPAKDNITIELSVLTTNTYLSIINVNGQVLLEQKMTGCKTPIDISNLPGGVYFVSIKNDKTVKTGKIVKE